MKLGDLDQTWDLIVIGGGIVGAGVLREAVRIGLKVLLLERQDFAWGTSSRSAKLVHGGLRYLKEGRIWLTKESVHARERLLKEAPGLVQPLGFLMPVYEGFGPGRWTLEFGLSVYDLLAYKRQHTFHNAEEFLNMSPHLKREGLKGGFHFYDAQVDDARLVLRLMMEAVDSGGTALNYTTVAAIERDQRGHVAGVAVQDTETSTSRTFSTRAVVNATGAWAEELHPSPEPKRHLRPLRGSHLIFPNSSLPLHEAVSFLHPSDRRPIYAFPWEGAVLFGTTDVDHSEGLSVEPVITREEVDYLMEGLTTFFPSLNITLKDCISSFAGIRPVLSEGKLTPSQESREHVVWVNNGLVTITGGKLTTFRKLAWDTLKALGDEIGSIRGSLRKEPAYSAPRPKPREYSELSADVWGRLYGRYGERAHKLIEMTSPKDLAPIPGTHTLWAELAFAAQYEQIRHLSDLLLRRTRIGLICPNGGAENLDRVGEICRPVAHWDEHSWQQELVAYQRLWKDSYSAPNHSL